MKLQHALGGLEGLGPIQGPETKVFVQPWEKTIFAIHVAMMGLSKHLDLKDVPTAFDDEWTWADLRKGAEAMNPFDYFRYRYYEKWLGGISGFFVQQGYITAEELEEKTRQYLADPASIKTEGGDPKIDEQVLHYLETGDSPLRDAAITPAFAVGDKVVVRDIPPTDHTRLPGHLRGKTGVIDVVYDGVYQYFCSTGPDGLGEPMPIYSVKFEPSELWEELHEDGNTAFFADLFEVYLEAA
ncbi:MAG: nitrile hydratase subunit beta [Rhodospirillaceae bacterium]|nr:nitrile hydratase subunit beta [Rhodospirillaceae bacterium]